MIRIKDFGRGIHSSDFERIFQKDVSLKKNGTGIGLFYSKIFIKTNGGKIDVDSMLGLGTTVTVTYPLCSPPSWIKTTLFLDKYRQIVIADDYAPNAELMKRKMMKKIIHTVTSRYFILFNFIPFFFPIRPDFPDSIREIE